MPRLRTAVPLLDREPRRARALARRARPLTPVFEASVLLWADRPEAAQRLLDPDGAASALIAVLDALLAGSGDEGRRLFALHEPILRATPAASGDLLAIEGFCAFYEERFDLARARLAVVANSLPNQPIGTAARFFLAAIAHRAGDAAVARRELARVLTHGVGARVLASARSEWTEHVGATLPRRRRPSALAELGLDLVAGLRLAFIVPRARVRRFSRAAIVRLLVLDVVLALAVRAIDAGGHKMLSGAGLAVTVLPLVAIGVAARLVTSGRGTFQRLAGSAYAAAPLLLLALFAVEQQRSLVAPTTTWRLFQVGLVLWTCAVGLRVASVVPRWAHVRQRLGAAAFFLLVLFLPPRVALFKASPACEQQADRLAASSAAIAPGRLGTPEVYFVGGAGWDYQDVFLRETRAAEGFIGDRYQAQRRSIVLTNDAFAQYLYPPLTNASLRHTLSAVGERMNREEDVLFLYLTSHGSSAGLALSFADSAEHDPETLEPRELRAMLDGAGIRWRVIVVQGCESGVFIDALKDDHAIVATAASTDRPSYGCGNGRAFTEFGTAFLAERLPNRSLSIADALRQTATVVGEREAESGVLPSRPQVVVGAAIEAKLGTL